MIYVHLGPVSLAIERQIRGKLRSKKYPPMDGVSFFAEGPSFGALLGPITYMFSVGSRCRGLIPLPLVGGRAPVQTRTDKAAPDTTPPAHSCPRRPPLERGRTSSISIRTREARQGRRDQGASIFFSQHRSSTARASG